MHLTPLCTLHSYAPNSSIYFIHLTLLLYLQDIDTIEQSLGPNRPPKRSRVLEMFHTHLEKFQLPELAKYVQG